jgi:membrane protease YdiL (CAAX protease family)
MKTIINWKVFWVLWVAAIVCTLLVLPYAVEFLLSKLDLSQTGLSLPVILLLQVVQAGILFAIAIFAGLFFAGRVGLGTPILDAALRGERVGDRLRALLPVSIVLGILSTLILLALEIWYFQPAMAKEAAETAAALNLHTGQPAAWKGLLASFYGGIGEEIFLRLFLMSLLVWLGSFVSKTAEGKPTSAVFWLANILAAILFGFGHLPAVSLIATVTPLVVARTVVLNGLVGIVFGWLYWKRGLESAMIAHFSADIILHVLLAL